MNRPEDRPTIYLDDHQMMMARKNDQIADRDDEIYRLRTTQAAAAHALDVLRQNLDLPLIPNEHPSETRKRIECQIYNQQK